MYVLYALNFLNTLVREQLFGELDVLQSSTGPSKYVLCMNAYVSTQLLKNVCNICFIGMFWKLYTFLW